ARRLLNMMEWWLCLALDREEVDHIGRFRELTPAKRARTSLLQIRAMTISPSSLTHPARPAIPKASSICIVIPSPTNHL
ncbi:MAG: hypothetical protein L0215_14230, partial [Gemmataceae bacterium]|nr:hypothetical protein [Gemmataceae bacterium]